MYSPTVLAHLDNPRHVGAMEDASAHGEARNPVCGDLLHFYLRVEERKIAASSFQAEGCPPTIAAASVLTELIAGLTVEEARTLSPTDVTRALEYLPRNKEHCSLLAIDALREALAALPSRVL